MSTPANRELDERTAAPGEVARTGDERVAAIKRQAVLTRVNRQSTVKQRRRAGKATRLARERARALGVTGAQRKTT